MADRIGIRHVIGIVGPHEHVVGTEHLDQMFERATKARFRAFRFQSTIAQLGRLKVKWSRDFTSEPSTETLSRDPSGRYFVSLRLDKPVIK